MGTRSLTHVVEHQQTILTVYRQYDGYPSGMGQDLQDFLIQFTVVNGIGLNETRKIANGMGCLAAQLVGHLKNGKIGNVYIYPPDAKDCGEEYVYHVEYKEGEIHLKCTSVGWGDYPEKILYSGPVSQFNSEKAEKIN